MNLYQWLTLGLGAAGFLLTWTLGWFGAGRVVEQMKADLKKDIAAERDKIVELLKELEDKFAEEQETQDHNFGEVGAAMRQYIADVEKKLGEIEIWGRDNYVRRPEFERAVETMRQDLKEMARSIKDDFREVFAKIDAKP